MDSSEISRTIRVKTDEREAAHIRSFTKWINSKLLQAQTNLKISNLFVDLQNGHALLTLLEILKHEKLPREKGRLRVHHVSNIEVVLKTMERDNIKLHGISAQAIADGVHKSTLGLVWSIILHYQVHGAMLEEEVEEPPEATANDASTTKKPKPQTEAAVEDRLLRWVQSTTDGYDDVIQVNDLSKSWRDGRAFNLLIHVHRNDLIKLEQVERMSNQGRLEHAFTVAEEHLLVEKLLEPSDVDQENPDKKLVMMYVSSLYESLRQYEPVKPAKRRKIVEEEMVASVSENVQSSIADVMPSEAFLKFKDDLSQTSNQVQEIENDFIKVEDTLQNRIDIELWENYEKQFQAAELEVDRLNEIGMQATNDSSVQPFEVEEIRRDLEVIDARWSLLRSRTEKQRNRIMRFQEEEEKKLNELRKVPSEPFLKFKDDLSQTSYQVQELENDLTTVEDALEQRIDIVVWENYEKQFQAAESRVDRLNETGMQATNDSGVQPFEVEEIHSDLKAIDDRWTSLRSRTEKQRNRIIRFQEKEEKELNEWLKQAGVFLDWTDEMDEQFDVIEEMKCEDDISELTKQAQALKELLHAMNTDPVAHNVLEFGRSLVMSNDLSADSQVKVKDQLIEMEKELETLKARAGQDIDRFNGNIDNLKQRQSGQMGKWRKETEVMCDWLDSMEDQLEVLDTHERSENITDIYKRLEECEKLYETIRNDAQPHSIVEHGELLMAEKTLSKEQKLKIEKQITEMKNEWKSLIAKCGEVKTRLSTIRDEYELEEKHKVEEWITKFELLMKQMSKVKGTVGKLKSLPIISERNRAFQECIKVVESIKPEYLHAVQCAEEVMTHDACPEVEKSQVKEDVELLKTTWESVLDVMDEEGKSIDAIMSQASDEQVEKVKEWRQKYNEVDEWYNIMSPKVEGNFSVGKTLPIVQKQIAEQEEISNEMVMTHENVEYLLANGRELLQNGNTPEAEKNKLRKDIANLVERWEGLRKTVNNRMERLVEMQKHISEYLAAKLDDWSNQSSFIEGWLTKEEKKFQAMGVIAPNLEAAIKQKPKVEALMKEMKQEEKKQIALLRLGEEILTDSSLSEEEKNKLQQELNTLKNRWQALDEKINWRIQRLDETISRLGSQQEDKLQKWRENAAQISDWLDKAQLRLAERGAIGSDLMSVSAQKEEFQVVLNESLEFQRHIYGFTEFGENLRTDPCINEEERTKVQQKTKSLNDRWDVIVQQINNHHTALEEQLEELEDKHKAELLGRWQEKFEPFSKWLIATETTIKSLKDIGENVLIVQRQQEETKVLMSQVLEKEPDFNEVISIAQMVNDDPLIEDSEAKTVEKEATSLSNKWVVVKETLTGRSESLRIRGALLGEQEEQLLHEWRRNIEPFNNWLSKVEDDGAYKLNENVGVNTIKDYSIRCKTLEREVEGRKPVLEEIEKLGRKLISNTAVRDEERIHIKEELEILLDRWKKLHVKIHDNNKWADIKLIELAKKEQETLDVWRKNVEPVNAWLDETNGKLNEIQNNSTESLQQRYLVLQRIKEDVIGHEEALARIVTIVGKLTDDENVSENEKNNIKAEMNRLQEKWNNTQNNVNLNYLSITEQLMELAQKEKATLEKWKKQTDPFKEWIVEAKGRFDNLQRGEGYDVVQEQHEKLETLSRELADHETDYGNISELKNSILLDEHLSPSFKDNIKDEGESLDKKWRELNENITSHSDRVQKQKVMLDDSQRGQLERWQEEFKNLTDQQIKTENGLTAFESLALDVDGAKKQSADLKVVEQEIHENRSQVEEVSSFCAEISNDPNIANKEKSRIKKEAELLKERQNKQEKLLLDCQRRLEGKIRELDDRQSSKLEKWKTSSQPLHEWLDGIEDDAKEFDAIGGNIVEVHRQFDELQKLSKEFKETEPDLFNVLKLGEDLSVDPQVSEEVRENVNQDVMLLRENHGNVAELLKSQREKMKSQLLKLQQHQEKCLIDWNERKTSVEIRVKTMEKRTGQWQAVGDTMEDAQTQKDALKGIEKDLESIGWELTAILEYGETLCRDKSIFDKEKEVIRAEMDGMERAFRNSQKNVEDRKLSLNSKLDELRKARANTFLDKWENSSSKTIKWMDTCEQAMQFDAEDKQSLADIRERIDDLDDLSEKLDRYEPEYNSTVKCGEDVIKEPSVESTAKEKVEDELSSLKERWRRINVDLDSLMSRLEDEETSLAKHHELSEKWHKDVQETRNWCRETQAKLEDLENSDLSNYDEVSEHLKELQIMIEMLPNYEVKVNELDASSRELAKNSKDKTENEKFISETQTLQNDFKVLKQSIEKAKSKMCHWESAHGQQLSDWNKKGERIERQLTKIETQWREISFLENSDEDQIKAHRPQLEAVVSDLNSLQPDYERHCSVGRQLSKDPALNSETRNAVEQKVISYEQRWNSLQLPRKLFMQLPRVAVDEAVYKFEERQVESVEMDVFDDLFGIDSTYGGNCQELKDWYVNFESSMKWCSEADDKVTKRSQPGEYIVLVERQHGEIEELIQVLTTYEATVSKVLDKGQHILDNSESLRLSKDDRSRLDNDLRTLKAKWEELQENAFDTERSLNEHLNKLREYHDWEEKAGALFQWLEMTDHKLDCCSEPSQDPDEKSKQKIFLEKFVTEKSQNEESITDVFNLGRYIVTNHLVLKDKYSEVDNDIDKFKNMWNRMLSKADEFCKLFGIPFSHIDLNSTDPLLQWKRNVDEVEKWIAEAHEKLNVKNNLKDYALLKTLPETANDITRGIDNYCVPQLNEITSKAQDILNDKDSNTVQSAEIAETISRLSKKIEALRQYTESQKVHVRNETLAFFTEKLNASESMVDRVLEDLKNLKSVGSEATVVRDQVNMIKNSEEYLQNHLSEFEESKRQIIEMEDKGYLATDGFEGTLKIKTVELEPRLIAVEKQFSDTKNRLAKGVISFHGQHKDDVKKWLRYCEKKLNEIDSDAVEINSVYEECIKLQELRREVIKGEQGFLSTLELNERLIAESILNEQQGNEYQGEMQAIAKSRNKLQRRIQEKNSRLYTTLIEGLNGILSASVLSFEEAQTALSEIKLSADFDTATEQMDGAKSIAENVAQLKQRAQETLELSQKITTCGILILNEEDKTAVDAKMKQLKDYTSTMPGKARLEFNRLLDEYLVLFRKEIEDRKTWIAVSENRMSSSYLEIEDLPGFQKELKEHMEFEQEVNHRNMEKMVDAAERVTELDKNHKLDVRNLEKRWKVLKQWSDEYSLDLQRIVKEWRVIKQEQDLMIEWLDPHEEQLAKINEKINWTDEGGMKRQIEDLKNIQAQLEDKGVVLSNSHMKGMALMKFLNEEAAASRTIDRDLAQLDRRWNSMAKDIIARIELLRNILYKQSDIKEKKERVNTYIDETNAELDEHEMKTQRLRGNVSHDVENGETVKEKKVRMKKEKENLQQDVVALIKKLEERIADFPKYQVLVDRINALSKDLEDVADEDSKASLHDELVNFNARWQVIVTRLEDYSDDDLPDGSSFGCMGFVKRKITGSTY